MDSFIKDIMIKAAQRIIVPSGMKAVTVDINGTSVTVYADGRPAKIVEGGVVKEIGWLEKAVRFDLGICPIHHRPIIIEKGLYSNENMWFLKMEYTKGWFLGKDGLWYYEELLNKGLPPDDTCKFLTNILFDSAQQVYDFWKANIKEVQPLYVL